MNEKSSAVGVLVKDQEIYAKNVISTVGAPKTFTRLISIAHQHLLKERIEQIQHLKIDPHISLMSMFIGYEGDATELNLPKQNYSIHPSWDHDKNWQLYLKDSTKFPAVFASFSSAKDPTYALRYPNKQVALVIPPCMYDSVSEYSNNRVKHRGAEYDTNKQEWTKQMLTIFLKEFPQLKGKIKFQALGTAVTNDFYLGTY